MLIQTIEKARKQGFSGDPGRGHDVLGASEQVPRIDVGLDAGEAIVVLTVPVNVFEDEEMEEDQDRARASFARGLGLAIGMRILSPELPAHVGDG
jgi:hypothetical protein